MAALILSITKKQLAFGRKVLIVAQIPPRKHMFERKRLVELETPFGWLGLDLGRLDDEDAVERVPVDPHIDL